MQTKVCTKCKEDVDATKFSKSGSYKGKQYYHKVCNQCRTQINRERRGQLEPKKFGKRTETHRECMNCNEMFLNEDMSGNTSYCKTCHKERFYDKEKARLATVRYRERHKERYQAAHRISQYNRRNKIKATEDGTVTDEFIIEILNKENCCWCKKFVEEDDRTIEHLVELSNGGLHSASNIDMSCNKCNSSRPNRNNDYVFI